MNHIEYLKSLRASDKRIDWCRQYPDIATCWDNFDRSNWMLWLDRKANLLDDRTRRLLACAFVRRTPVGDGRTTWDLLADPRSRHAVEVAERYANGEATEEELAAANAASTAAEAAANAAFDTTAEAAADVGADAAAKAAWATAGAACAATWATDPDAAEAATLTATWAAPDDSVDAGAEAAARAAQADIIREIAGNPFRAMPAHITPNRIENAALPQLPVLSPELKEALDMVECLLANNTSMDAETGEWDSMAQSSNVEAMELLVKHGYGTLRHVVGRRAFYKPNPKDSS